MLFIWEDSLKITGEWELVRLAFVTDAVHNVSMLSFLPITFSLRVNAYFFREALHQIFLSSQEET